MENTTNIKPHTASGKSRKGVLTTEIRSLRALLERVMRYAESESTEIDQVLKILDVHSRACTRLATLLRAESALGEGADLQEEFRQVLLETLREMGMEGGA